MQLVVRLGVVPPHVLRAAAVAERLEEVQARPRKNEPRHDRELDGALVREGLLDVRLGCEEGFARS